MLALVYQIRFKKDAKRYANNKKAQQTILETISLLQTGKPLPVQYREHKLAGHYIHSLECHCAPDILLIYQRTDSELRLYRVGSHADLF
ncbi:mRNA interferase YafQ [Pragia fontium]|uniref:type II toxin-antitoxin system RelE/ParE family toxin n=1 Tax=Pragia fontium TaxID=82985 RepID=UPI000E03EB3D|nr:type II toxin-antitoxin system YafQ family toxin [Pragia fontium]SUB81311.1 mRNA interferase YafQ [Pragia fontium]